MRTSGIMKTAAGAVVLLACIAMPVRAQSDTALRFAFGFAEGATEARRDQHALLDVSVRLRAIERLFLVSGFRSFNKFADCAGISCGYPGNTFSAGAAFAALDTDRMFSALTVELGVFGRESGPEFEGGWHATWSGSLDAEFRVLGPLALQASAFRRYVRDALYSNVMGSTPTFTGVSLGVSLHLDGSDDGG
jgi:hypothetical protein